MCTGYFPDLKADPSVIWTKIEIFMHANGYFVNAFIIVCCNELSEN